MVREYPSRMIRLHQRWPSMAKSIMRPSINQYSWAAVALKGCGWGTAGGGVERLRAWNVRIDAAVEGHNALDGPHREIVLAPQTPDAKAAGIGMAFLSMIDSSSY